MFIGDFCNRRSIKCTKINGPLAPCQNCEDFDVPCTYDRPTRRRGARKHISPAASQIIPPEVSSEDNTLSSSHPTRPDSQSRSHIADPSWDIFNSKCTLATTTGNDAAPLDSWRAFAVTCQNTIQDLAQVYFEIVYPMYCWPLQVTHSNQIESTDKPNRFPLFHRPSFLKQLENMEHLQDRGLFASTMAMCALTSARARDGALYSNRWRLSQLTNPPSEAFWAAAKESIPHDLATAKGTEYMRACAMLSIASIQSNQIQDMQKFAGIYHTLSVMDGLHDEKLWPKPLDGNAIEIRRRLVSLFRSLSLSCADK